MRIKSSEPKYNLGRLGKGLITSLCIKAKSRPKKCKKTRYAIGNFSTKDLSKIIREFKKLPYKFYYKTRPKHESTDSYFCISGYLAKYIMRDDDLNSHVLPCKNENDCYETDYDLAHLFCGRYIIRRVPSWQKFIVGLFYRWVKIKINHRWWTFYGGRRIRMCSQKY